MNYSKIGLFSICASTILSGLVGCSKPSSSGDNGSGSSTVSHIVSQNAIQYLENGVDTNDAKSTAENTAYVLDSAGLIIKGTFDSGAAAHDFFKFKRGTFNHLHVQVYVDGQKISDSSQKTVLTMDAVADDGYSTLMGHGYFNRAWFMPQNTAPQDWVISVFTNVNMGKSYIIEIIGAE